MFRIGAGAVVITTGRFMNAVMHIGLTQNFRRTGGRQGDYRISINARFWLSLGRFEAGTPARLYRDSIDWSKTKPDPAIRCFFLQLSK